jgi:DNA-binding transcriptional ArsR family regulator
MPQLDTTFAALADPTRRAILAELAKGEASVQDLARPFAISQPAISRHLKVLEDAGLIEVRIAGTSRPRRLKPEATDMLWDWLNKFRALLEKNYTRLDALLAEPEGLDPDT